MVRTPGIWSSVRIKSFERFNKISRIIIRYKIYCTEYTENCHVLCVDVVILSISPDASIHSLQGYFTGNWGIEWFSIASWGVWMMNQAVPNPSSKTVNRCIFCGVYCNLAMSHVVSGGVLRSVVGMQVNESAAGYIAGCLVMRIH